ncbi:MAG: DsrE family protein [Cytophagales bacterium]|nr:DsrE family protein [Cytophagales bacterium]
MNKRIIIRWMAASLVGVVIAASAQAQANQNKASQPSQMQHLVIQVSEAEPAKWNLVLNNAKNVQEELGAKNVEIEIVAYGPGLGMLKLEAVSNSRVTEAAQSGIKLVACENTMRNQKISKDDLHPAATYVMAGVVQIMKRQAQGWSYIRP